MIEPKQPYGIICGTLKLADGRYLWAEVYPTEVRQGVSANIVGRLAFWFDVHIGFDSKTDTVYTYPAPKKPATIHEATMKATAALASRASQDDLLPLVRGGKLVLGVQARPGVYTKSD